MFFMSQFPNTINHEDILNPIDATCVFSFETRSSNLDQTLSEKAEFLSQLHQLKIRFFCGKHCSNSLWILTEDTKKYQKAIASGQLVIPLSLIKVKS